MSGSFSKTKKGATRVIFLESGDVFEFPSEGAARIWADERCKEDGCYTLSKDRDGDFVLSELVKEGS